MLLIILQILQNEYFDDDEDDYNMADDNDGMHFVFHIFPSLYLIGRQFFDIWWRFNIVLRFWLFLLTLITF